MRVKFRVRVRVKVRGKGYLVTPVDVRDVLVLIEGPPGGGGGVEKV